MRRTPLCGSGGAVSALLKPAAALAVAAALGWAALQAGPGARVRQLPAGVVTLSSEMVLEDGAELRGHPAGTTLRLAAGFNGRAAIVVRGNHVRLSGFTIDGNRGQLETRAGLPAWDTPFARFTRANGVLAEGVSDLTISRVSFRNIAGFAVLASRVRGVSIDRASVSDSGSRNPAGRNNTTGGILIEEGSTQFRATRCQFRNVRGNGVWTHSLSTSPRNADGLIAANRFERMGRDAVQVGHAVDVRVEGNSGRYIGYPREEVDIENLGIPVALDTAGNVERTVYAGNSFEEINGQCIDLDGFHDGEVRANVCVNHSAPAANPFGHFGIVLGNSDPQMRSRNIRIVENVIEGPLYGGVFLIGEGHLVTGNRLLRLNTARCNACYFDASEPDLLQTGIYLGKGAARPDPARNNTIAGNEVTGWNMARRCIGLAPGIAPAWNRTAENRCVSVPR
jgi:hypothetical protein